MALFEPSEFRLASGVARMLTRNPFVPEWLEHEREALGEAADDDLTRVALSVRADAHDLERPEVQRLNAQAHELVQAVRGRLAKGKPASDEEVEVYRNLAMYCLYYRTRDALYRTVADTSTGRTARRTVDGWDAYVTELTHLFAIRGRHLPEADEGPHLFAIFFQIARAFFHIFHHLVGASAPLARTRSAIWQSIFTHDLFRYRRALYTRMADITTLIVGESGTGKELVARAIGRSRYIPFDPAKKQFTTDFRTSFHPLNITALPETLVESELFGHRRGAFTGALEDRVGWLETCDADGTVFLDEIGEATEAVQVKLLRVLQARTFQRVGDTEPRHFDGKFIAATNRNLAAEMEAGRFRPDFYYRMCSDVIETAPLRDQLRDNPGELPNIVWFIAKRVAGDGEVAQLTDEVVSFVHDTLGIDYDWPGNFRELEQCVRNVMIRCDYRPPAMSRPGDPRAAIAAELLAGGISADELVRRYCTLVYSQTGSYQETARRLALDRRTVKSRIDEDLLARLTGRPAPVDGESDD